MTGFDLQPGEAGQGYGLIVVPNADFMVHYDGRLTEKWSGHTFDTVDELGLPKQEELEQDNGSRTWFTRGRGLSRLSLGRDLDLDSGWYDLGDSYSDGRVVVLSGEATAPEKQ